MKRGSPAAAFFDVDGTVVRGNIVLYYARMRTASMPAWMKWLWALAYLPTAAYYFVLDLKSRRRFNEVFYRSYARFSVSELEELAQWHFEEFMRPSVYADARRCIRRHQQQGHAVVLVTGSVTAVLRPLAEWLEADETYAAELEERNGHYSGRLSFGPITDAAKVEALREFARRNALKLEDCYAYADSMDDVPMLSQVGHAAVVNPGKRLKAVAEKRQWDVLRWKETVGQSGER
ncbi:MAG TPA: HAD-IB family hydrolase [Acidobacteriota bacterium]|nr:HAD-IB family hydrolase [Acidobacteriota bacterium]